MVARVAANIILFLTALGAVAQLTNPPVAPPASAPSVNNVAADIARLLEDLGVNMTPSGLTKLFAAAWFLARLFRKYAPAGWQNGSLASFLSHIALELPAAAAAGLPPEAAAPPASVPPKLPV